MSTLVKENSSRVNLLKGMQSGSSFELEQVVPEMTEYKGYLKPRLLTNLLNPTFDPLVDEVFKFDADNISAVLPSGKRFDAKGDLMLKDRPDQHMFRVPSAGLTYTVSARDIKNKRIPGTQNMMTFDYLTSREQKRAMDAWDLFTEYNMGKLLTSDTMDNLDNGKYYTSPNFYTEIVGSARPAAINMDLANTDLMTYMGAIEDAKDKAQEAAAKLGKSITSFAVVSGKTYFNDFRKLEANENLAREIRGSDLAQEGVDVLSDGEFANIRFIDGSDGCRYIKYSAGILGQSMIGANDAYLVPLGVEDLFTIALAPSDDKEHIGKQAQMMYMYREETRKGYAFELASNRLFMCRHPHLITRLVAG